MRASSTSGVSITLPELIRLRQRATGFSFLPRQPVHSLLAGRQASKLRGRGLNFEEIRRYLPGDDIRQIDWKVTARTRQTQSRVYTEERERPVLAVVDQRLGMFFGSKRQMKSVTAAEAAALVAWRTIAVKDRVGLVLFNDSRQITIRPQRSQNGVMRILHAVVEMNQALRADDPVLPRPAALNEALESARRLAPHDCLIVAITDGAGSDEQTQKKLTEISQHNDVLVVFVFDPLETELPVAGELVFSDGTSQLAFDSRHAAAREQFQQEFSQLRAAAHKFLLTRETPVLPLSTALRTIDQIARALGHPPVRGRR